MVKQGEKQRRLVIEIFQDISQGVLTEENTEQYKAQIRKAVDIHFKQDYLENVLQETLDLCRAVHKDLMKETEAECQAEVQAFFKDVNDLKCAMESQIDKKEADE